MEEDVSNISYLMNQIYNPKRMVIGINITACFLFGVEFILYKNKETNNS